MTGVNASGLSIVMHDGKVTIHSTEDYVNHEFDSGAFGKMKTPEILIPALRQYQHNDGSELLAGFDHDETSKLVMLMEKTLKAQSRLLVAYRTGGRPPEWVFDTLEKARKAGLEI